MTTTVVYADTSDGHVVSSFSTYSTARSGYNLTSNDSLVFCYFGQQWDSSGNSYILYESYEQFDTSGVGTDTISSAILSLNRLSGSPTQAFDLQARVYDWGTGVTTADWIAGASLSTKTLAAHFAGTSWAAGYNDFADDALPANINTSGQTKLMLSSSRLSGGDAPADTTSEYGRYYASDQAGTTNDPKITITHAAAASLFLILEDGSGAYEKEDSSGGIVLEA